MKKLICYLIAKFHPWHKDWKGCFLCEWALRNYPHKIESQKGHKFMPEKYYRLEDDSLFAKAIRRGEHMKLQGITRADIQLREQQKDAALTEIREYCAAKRLIVMEREQLEKYRDEDGNKVKEDIEAILSRYGLRIDICPYCGHTSCDNSFPHPR